MESLWISKPRQPLRPNLHYLLLLSTGIAMSWVGKVVSEVLIPFLFTKVPSFVEDNVFGLVQGYFEVSFISF